MEQINRLEKEIADLRSILQEKEAELCRIKNEWMSGQDMIITNDYTVIQYQCENGKARTQISDKLQKWAIERYSRQILLPNIGVKGQEKLCAARVLVVGAGGLGCPAAVYLAGAGVGEIGIVDHDTVDVTNIHRQFLHEERDQFTSKAESAAAKLRSLNSHIKVTPYNMQLDSSNALRVASEYDIVLDCTDNVPSRYLLNDTCVIAKVPLISGSALKMEGQLTVYGYRASKNPNEKEREYAGPCYRCVFPAPPPPAAVGSCSANGVAGPAPGAIGALQALEAIKYIVGATHEQLLVERLLLFDGDDMTFRTVKLRPRNVACAACSNSPTITRLIDYETFCQSQAKEKKTQDSLKSSQRKTEKEKRMSGRSYYGFRTTGAGEGGQGVGGANRRWVQDVLKAERRMGPPCSSDICSKGTSKKCPTFDQVNREALFSYFWNVLDWKGKRAYVRSLVDSVPVKRRRVKHKGEVSRKVESKLYHLLYGEERLPVCRVMFLHTLGIKEAMVRCWLLNTEKPKTPKKPIKSLNVDSYIDNLPKTQPKCQYCLTNTPKYQYIALENVKNLFQLYNMYVKDMRERSMEAASRKTFSKVIAMKNVRIFKPKNVSDICDVVGEHNNLPSLGYDAENDLDLKILPSDHRVSPEYLSKSLQSENYLQRHLLVDVRSEAEFHMCNIDGSTNYPIEKLSEEKLGELVGKIRDGSQMIFVCRRGNDSQVAAQKVLDLLDPPHRSQVKDLEGGLHSWARNIDNSFPIY